MGCNNHLSIELLGLLVYCMILQKSWSPDLMIFDASNESNSKVIPWLKSHRQSPQQLLWLPMATRPCNCSPGFSHGALKQSLSEPAKILVVEGTNSGELIPNIIMGLNILNIGMLLLSATVGDPPWSSNNCRWWNLAAFPIESSCCWATEGQTVRLRSFRKN